MKDLIMCATIFLYSLAGCIPEKFCYTQYWLNWRMADKL